MNKNVKRMSYITMLLAMAILLHYIESLIPIPVPVPGFKLGFANIVGLIAYYLFGFKVMLGVNIARCFVGGLMSGTFIGAPGFQLSLGGVILSTCMVGIFGKMSKDASCVFLSVLSAIFHCTGQIIVALGLYGVVMASYLPVLIVLSIPSGIFTGYIALQVITRLNKKYGKDL